jgi:hypothetical protein
MMEQRMEALLTRILFSGETSDHLKRDTLALLVEKAVGQTAFYLDGNRAIVIPGPDLAMFNIEFERGHKIQAIKAFRAATGINLRDAKLAVEAYPKNFANITPVVYGSKAPDGEKPLPLVPVQNVEGADHHAAESGHQT